MASLLSKDTALLLARCNSIAIPLHETAHAWILIGAADLAKFANFNLTATFSLTFQNDSPGDETRTWKGLVLCREPQIVLSGKDDPNGVYLVELADARWRVKNSYAAIPINAFYNVPANSYRGAPDDQGYLEDSLDGGDLWTWDEMIGDLWGVMSGQLGSYPGLPWSPNGTPEGWVFQGMSAWEALKQALARVGCAIRANLEANVGSQFTIVQIGGADASVSAVLTAADLANRKIHDARFYGVNFAPASVRVHFHRQEKYYANEKTTDRDSADNWLINSVYTVDITGSGTGTAHHPLWDDMPAIYDPSGALTNGTALHSRAQERSDDYYRMLQGARLWKRYSGLLPLTPGGSLKGVRFSSDGYHCWTEIVQHPLALMGLDADGAWCECAEDSTKLHTPNFRPSYPLYPQHAQDIKLKAAAPINGTIDAVILRRDNDAQAWVEKEKVWAIDHTGSTLLTNGARYTAVYCGFEPGGSYYLSLVNSNQGNALSDGTKWLALVTDPGGVPAYPTTPVATVNIAVGAQSIATVPEVPMKLKLAITDGSGLLSVGHVTFKDALGTTETISVGGGGTHNYTTTNAYGAGLQVTVGPDLALVGVGTTPTIGVTVAQYAAGALRTYSGSTYATPVDTTAAPGGADWEVATPSGGGGYLSATSYAQWVYVQDLRPIYAIVAYSGFTGTKSVVRSVTCSGGVLTVVTETEHWQDGRLAYSV